MPSNLSNDQSAQPCGCDEGAKHQCEAHRLGAFNIKKIAVKSVKSEAQVRKEHPLATGVLDYFPDALMEVAGVSFVGNQQHNPGQPLHWAKHKSTDEADALLRHLKDRGKRDSDGVRHSAKVAWRALALLQREIEGESPSSV